MTSTPALSIVGQRTSRTGDRGFLRAALVAVGAVAILTATNHAAEAQAAPVQPPRWEFLVSSGKVIPTGGQREAIKRGNLSAAQLFYLPRPALALNATLGWARSRDLASPDDPKLDLFAYDLGAEVRAPRMSAGAITFGPFAGVGAGGRSYNYRSLEVDATHNVAAYGSAGGELGFRRVRLRLEVREYVSGFKPLRGGGPADTRNDVVLVAGLHIARR